MLALFQCYPSSACMADGEAPAWAVQNRKPWHVNWGAASPWDDFRQCTPQRRVTAPMPSPISDKPLPLPT